MFDIFSSTNIKYANKCNNSLNTKLFKIAKEKNSEPLLFTQDYLRYQSLGSNSLKIPLTFLLCSSLSEPRWFTSAYKK